MVMPKFENHWSRQDAGPGGFEKTHRYFSWAVWVETHGLNKQHQIRQLTPVLHCSFHALLMSSPPGETECLRWAEQKSSCVTLKNNRLVLVCSVILTTELDHQRSPSNYMLKHLSIKYSILSPPHQNELTFLQTQNSQLTVTPYPNITIFFIQQDKRDLNMNMKHLLYFETGLWVKIS